MVSASWIAKVGAVPSVIPERATPVGELLATSRTRLGHVWSCFECFVASSASAVRGSRRDVGWGTTEEERAGRELGDRAGCELSGLVQLGRRAGRRVDRLASPDLCAGRASGVRVLGRSSRVQRCNDEATSIPACAAPPAPAANINGSARALRYSKRLRASALAYSKPLRASAPPTLNGSARALRLSGAAADKTKRPAARTLRASSSQPLLPSS